MHLLLNHAVSQVEATSVIITSADFLQRLLCVQELAFVLTDTLRLPCIDPTYEANHVSPDDCIYSKVGLEAVDKRLVHYTLLSRCPACVKGGGSCLYFWQRAMPHCCQWLRQHIDWMLSVGLGGRLNIGPYLDVLGRSTGHACLATVHVLD